MDLRDDQAVSGQRRPGADRHHVPTVSRCPGAEPWHRQELDETLTEHRGLTEAGPTLSVVVGSSGGAN